MWKSAYVGVYQLLNWKMQGETLKFTATILMLSLDMISYCLLPMCSWFFIICVLVLFLCYCAISVIVLGAFVTLVTFVWNTKNWIVLLSSILSPPPPAAAAASSSWPDYAIINLIIALHYHFIIIIYYNHHLIFVCYLNVWIVWV